MQIRAISEIDSRLVSKQEYLRDLFGVDLGAIFVFTLSKEDFSKFNKDPWVVGFAVPRKNIICIINQDESGRDYEEWLKVIIHELVHLFYIAKFKISEPAWFFEGLACYLAGQKKAEKKVSIKSLIENFSKYDKETYELGYSAIKKMITDEEND